MDLIKYHPMTGFLLQDQTKKNIIGYFPWCREYNVYDNMIYYDCSFSIRYPTVNGIRKGVVEHNGNKMVFSNDEMSYYECYERGVLVIVYKNKIWKEKLYIDEYSDEIIPKKRRKGDYQLTMEHDNNNKLIRAWIDELDSDFDGTMDQCNLVYDNGIIDSCGYDKDEIRSYFYGTHLEFNIDRDLEMYIRFVNK